jgi:hypothetical protein
VRSVSYEQDKSPEGQVLKHRVCLAHLRTSLSPFPELDLWWKVAALLASRSVLILAGSDSRRLFRSRRSNAKQATHIVVTGESVSAWLLIAGYMTGYSPAHYVHCHRLYGHVELDSRPYSELEGPCRP